MKPKAQLICLSLMVVILFGCSPKNNSTPLFPATATLQPHSTSSSTIDIGSPTVTNTPGIGVVSTSTATIPTLEASEAFLQLREYFQNNAPCHLPCWGGILPGKSTLTDAQRQFAMLSGISDNTYFGLEQNTWHVGALYISYPLDNIIIRIRPGYMASTEDEKILLVSISTQSLPQNPNGSVYGDDEYMLLLSAYAINQILTTYGVPDLIFARADINVSEPTAPDYFIIRLLYLDIGMFISYTMPMETKETTFEFCPSVSLINLDLISQDIGSGYQEFFRDIGHTEWASLPLETYDQPLEKALGLTNEEFSQLIISTPEICFESPIDIWPKP